MPCTVIEVPLPRWTDDGPDIIVGISFVVDAIGGVGALVVGNVVIVETVVRMVGVVVVGIEIIGGGIDSKVVVTVDISGIENPGVASGVVSVEVVGVRSVVDGCAEVAGVAVASEDVIGKEMIGVGMEIVIDLPPESHPANARMPMMAITDNNFFIMVSK